MAHKTFLILFLIIFWFSWIKLISFLFMSTSIEYPSLRARLGTVLSHSSDGNGQFLGAIYDSNAHIHNYCLYPKPEANAKVILERRDNEDCSKWYGQLIFYEGWWVSEIEKFWWDRKQHISDCGDCTDL